MLECTGADCGCCSEIFAFCLVRGPAAGRPEPENNAAGTRHVHSKPGHDPMTIYGTYMIGWSL